MTGFDLQDALEALLKFRNERDWEQYHTPKNLSMSIAIEAAELMEHFQWKPDNEAVTPQELEKIKDEVADIAAYLLMLSHDLGINLNQSMLEKIEKNALKYPIEKSRGRKNKYDNL